MPEVAVHKNHSSRTRKNDIWSPGQCGDIYAETQYPLTFGWSDLTSFRREGKKLMSGARDELFDIDRDAHETSNVLEGNRRTYRELAAALVPLRRVGPAAAPVDAETRAKLASLGYVAPSGKSPANDDRADPRDRTALFHDFETANGDRDVLESLVRRDPMNRVFRSTLARAYDAAGEHGKAIKLYRQSVAIAPNDADAWYDLAAALQDRGDPKEARTAIEESLRRDPNRSDGHNMLGVALARGGNPSAAVDEFRKALAIDPRSARAYNNLGNALRDLGRSDEAFDAYQRAAALAPRYPDPLNGIGVVLVQQGRGRDAIPYFDRAIALAPAFYEAQLNRAIATDAAGDRPDAVAQLEKLLNVLPHGHEFDDQRKTARALLSRLRG